MRKMQLVLTGVFLSGILLGGIGTGIALVEYSSLSYGGEYRIGEENLVTNDFDFEFDPEEGIVSVDDDVYLDGNRVRKIVSDPKVPAGIVRYQVTYNEKMAAPFVVFDMNEEDIESDDRQESEGEIIDGEEEAEQKEPNNLGRVRLTASYQGSDLGILIQNKDRFLEELKNKVISDYEVLYITDIKVMVNPETAPYVKLGSDIR